MKGFLGPRKFADGDQVKKDQVVFTIEPETYQAAVDQKKAQLDAARAALANAETQLKRAAELLRTNTGTQVTYDQRLAEQLQAKAQVEDASAQLRDAELQLSYTDIKSPIDGRIGRAAFSPGNLVSPESGVLATVVSENPIRVLFPSPSASCSTRGATRPPIRTASWCASGWPTVRSTRKRARSTSSTTRSTPRPTARSCAPPSQS